MPSRTGSNRGNRRGRTTGGRSTRTAGATGGTRSRSQQGARDWSNASANRRRTFARNNADMRARQAAKWPEHRLSNYQTQQMTSINGKRETYHVKTDSRGRIRILDTGVPPPKGYYGAGGRYFALKENARIAKSSNDKQKAFYYTNYDAIMGEGGAVDRMSRQGQIQKTGRSTEEDGPLAEVNFRKDAKTRRMMDENSAYYEGQYAHAGQRNRAKSRYIILIGQDGREA